MWQADGAPNEELPLLTTEQRQFDDSGGPAPGDVGQRLSAGRYRAAAQRVTTRQCRVAAQRHATHQHQAIAQRRTVRDNPTTATRHQHKHPTPLSIPSFPLRPSNHESWRGDLSRVPCTPWCMCRIRCNREARSAAPLQCDPPGQTGRNASTQ